MDAKQKMAIETLLQKASDAKDAAQAVNFAQAACNAANAVRVMAEIDCWNKDKKS
jgi:hypothetical protein